MARIKFIRNILDPNSAKELTGDFRTVRDIVDAVTVEERLVTAERYNARTGETDYVTLTSGGDSVSVTACIDGRDCSLDDEIGDAVLVMVAVLPMGYNTQLGAAIGGVVGFLLGAALTIATWGAGAPVAIGLGAAIFGVGLAVGMMIGMSTDMNKKRKNNRGLEGQSSPGVRGSANQPLTNNTFPLVLGKHAATPFIVGSPYTISTGRAGKEQTIRALYCVGYAPLRITDIKLGDLYLAHNRAWRVNPDGVTVMRGKLSGIDPAATGGSDRGDIVKIWRNNDVEIEILQPDADGNVDYGAIYSEAVIEDMANATPLFIAENIPGPIGYKGLMFDSTFRNNTVRFSQSCPKKILLELDAQNGLYSSRTYSNDDGSEVRYYSIPVWYAIQWRAFSENNPSSDAERGAGWNSFTRVGFGDGNYIYPTGYDLRGDRSAHAGNSLKDSFNEGWAGVPAFNLQQLAGGLSDQQKISQMRFTAEVEFTAEQCRSFLKGDNPARMVEVRVIRLSPCYLDQTSGDSKWGPSSYQDVVQWTTITTWKFDERKLLDTGSLEKAVLRPLPEEKMRKLCLLAVKATADTTENIKGRLNNLMCTAEAFAPTYDTDGHRWLPESINEAVEYRDPDGAVIEGGDAHERYEAYRRDGKPASLIKRGNDYQRTFLRLAMGDVDARGRTIISEDAYKYLDANVASSFLLALMGPQNGLDAQGYKKVNMTQLAELYEFCQDVTDGSTYSSDETELLPDGTVTTHKKGDEVHVRFEANGYVYKAEKMETVLQKILMAGRSVITRDEINRISVAIDKPSPYPSMLINQQNCISGTNTISYEPPPSGLTVQYPDENDGYAPNYIYCMADGENPLDPSREMLSYQFPFVTNAHQAWSLGRYFIACRVLGREVLTRKVGPEGFSCAIGDTVLVQDDTLLIGTDFGGRIMEVIESADGVIGFTVNEEYEYTGEVDRDGNSLQGVEVLQPARYGDSRVVTMRLCRPGTAVEVDGVTYTVRKGRTNLVIFDEPIREGKKGIDGIMYVPEPDNIVAFGKIGKITATYRVQKIRPEKDRTFTLTLTPYSEDIYRYGEELPSFQNNMTIPDRSGDDYFDLSGGNTPADREQQNANNISTAITNAEIAAQKDVKTEPWVYMENHTGAFAVDEDGYPAERDIIAVIHAKRKGVELPFRIGTVEAPDYLKVTEFNDSRGHGIIVSSIPGVPMEKGSFNVPVVVYEYVGETAPFGRGDDALGRGDVAYGRRDMSLMGVYPQTFTWSLSRQYTYLGRLTELSQIPDKNLLYPGDYFLWGAENRAQYEYGDRLIELVPARVYRWNGFEWAETSDAEHLSAAFKDILNMGEDKWFELNYTLRESLQKIGESRAIAEKLGLNGELVKTITPQVFNELYANRAYIEQFQSAVIDAYYITSQMLRTDNVEAITGFIERLTAKVAFIESVFSKKILIQQGGSIRGGDYDESGNNDNGGRGFYISADGQLKAVSAEMVDLLVTGRSSYTGTLHTGALEVQEETDGNFIEIPAGTTAAGAMSLLTANGYTINKWDTRDDSSFNFTPRRLFKEYVVLDESRYNGNPILKISFNAMYNWGLFDSFFILTFTPEVFILDRYKPYDEQNYEYDKNAVRSIRWNESHSLTLQTAKAGTRYLKLDVPAADPRVKGRVWQDNGVLRISL